VVICSAFAAGPLAAWPTLEPILIGEGVFAGPDQQLKLTSVFALAATLALISQLLSGILYDAIGARTLAALSCFLILLCQVVMAISIKFQCLNPLLWVAYPLAVASGYMNNMGGYAWLYLLPCDQSSVASIIGVTQLLSESFALVAVFLHSTFNLGLLAYFSCCACLSLMAGVVSLCLIPSRKLSKEVASAVQHTKGSLDVESSSYGATQDSAQIMDADDDSLWNTLCRIAASFRDAGKCMIGLYPFFFFCTLFMSGISIYMFATFPQIVMHSYYDAFLGKAAATTLLEIWGGVYPCIGACSILLLGRAVPYFGYVRCFVSLSCICVLNLILFGVPHLVAQVVGQVCLAIQCTAWYVMVPIFCLSYAPPELYGTVFGIYCFVSGVLQLPCSPLALLAGHSVSDLWHGGHSPLASILWTTMGLWCACGVISTMLLLMYWSRYPMPAAGSTTMAEVQKAWKGKMKHGKADADIQSLLRATSKGKKSTSDEALSEPEVLSSSRLPTCCSPCLPGSWILSKRSRT